MLNEFKEMYGNVEGMDELFGLMETPDIIFDQVFPTITSQLKQELEEPVFMEAIKEVQENSEDFEEEKKRIEDFIKELENAPEDTKDLSKNKIAFLKMILEAVITEPYDLTVELQLLYESSKVPVYANPTDTGADVYAIKDFTIPAQARGFTIPTGLAMAIPTGWGITIRPRSGMNRKTSIRVSLGTIDNGYRDELGVVIDNLSDEPYEVTEEDRICQFVAEKAYRVKWKTVADVKTIGKDRGGGFGSTGK